VEVLALVSVKGPIAYIGHSKFHLFHGLLHILLPLLSGGKRGACDALRNRGLNQRQRKSFLSLLFSGEQFYPKWYRLLLCLCCACADAYSEKEKKDSTYDEAPQEKGR